MFTVEQIKAAHGKVKSGADFPAYIQEIKAMGVIHYETYVTDGHVDYYGVNGYTITAPAKYGAVAIADKCNSEQFMIELKEHQKGNTDYPTFISMSAEMGIEKWAVSMEKMTCTYYDKKGNEVLVEKIPQ
ncbi:MAG: phage envelope protein [Flavobacteriia bacterium]|nr:MAG: phage envelope protein [Flavobacteriia bacterium]